MNITLFKRQAPAWIAFSLCLGLGSSAFAQVTIDRAWVRATVPNQSATGAFLRMTAAKDVELLSVRSPVAGLAEVHEMTMDNGIMKMRAVGRLQLKAGQTVELKSGGYHLMILELKQQIKPGETVPLTLEFKAADASISKVEVKAIASFAPPAP
jgi:copper(I)-binding protein